MKSYLNPDNKITKDYFNLIGNLKRFPQPNAIEQYISSVFFPPSVDFCKVRNMTLSNEASNKQRASVLNFDYSNKFKNPVESQILFIEANYSPETNVLLLRSNEEDFINEVYFKEKTKKNLERIISLLLSFFRKYKDEEKFSLIECLEDIPHLLAVEADIYKNEPQLKYKDLKITSFKDIISRNRKSINAEIKDCLKLLESPKGIILASNDLGHKTSKGGLVLQDNIRLPSSFMEKFCKRLKKDSLIDSDTKYNTLQNIFVRKQEVIPNKIKWLVPTNQLKYLINQLYKNNIIEESGYNQKWLDVTTCFTSANGNNFSNKTFSKNTSAVDSSTEKKLDKLVEFINFQLKS